MYYVFICIYIHTRMGHVVYTRGSHRTFHASFSLLGAEAFLSLGVDLVDGTRNTHRWQLVINGCLILINWG